MIDYSREIDCRRMRARLTKAGCLKRQYWSLTHADDPFAAACWDCPEALPQVKGAAKLIAREPAQRLCPDCGIREREVTWEGRVLPFCRECQGRRCLERLWGKQENAPEADTSAGDSGEEKTFSREEPLRPIWGGAI